MGMDFTVMYPNEAAALFTHACFRERVLEFSHDYRNIISFPQSCQSQKKIHPVLTPYLSSLKHLFA